MYVFYETENECNVAAVKDMWQGMNPYTAARCFHIWDKFWTNWGQKARRLFGHYWDKDRTFVQTFISGAGRFHRAGEELLPVLCIDTSYHECAGALLEKKQPGSVCLAVCRKAFGSPTGYNFPRNIIVALPKSFRKQSLAKIFTVLSIACIGIFPIRFQLFSKRFQCINCVCL